LRAYFRGDNLILEIPLLDRVGRLAVRLDRELVLLLAREAVLRRDVLRRHAHVAMPEGVVQRAGHRVDDRRVAHALSPAPRGKEIRRAAHALGAAADRRARSRNHPCLAVAHCALPCKSCSPECSLRTAANSPTLARPLKRTTPSISGASALERPSPGSSTMTFRVLPIFAFSRAALIAACACISRPRRSSLTSPGTASGRALAAAPATGE